MKLLKKISLLVLAILILTMSAYAYGTSTLDYLGVLPPDVEDDTVVTREYLAYTLSNVLVPNSQLDRVDTDFLDVDQGNIYSGYIKFISDSNIMTGNGDGYFRPKDAVNFATVSKTLVSVLGYNSVAESKGGWPGGYISVASELKLYKGVSVSDNAVTYGELKTMLINALDVKVMEEKYYMADGEIDTLYSKSSYNDTLALGKYKLTEYKGVIINVDSSKGKADVSITESDGYGKYNIGDRAVLGVCDGINIASYRNIPVEFVIYDDTLIVDVSVSNDVNVKFGVVDSVNNEVYDTSYNIKYINALTLLDDATDYEFADDCIFSLNTERLSGTIDLLGRYVRIASKDDEIISLETWDLEDISGIITDAGDKFLNYTIGNDEKRLDKIDSANDKFVVIDGEIRNYKELKQGMVFSYYRDYDADTLVIIATERTLTDTLSSYSFSEKLLNIGNLDVEYNNNIFLSENGIRYTKGIAGISKYIDTDVCVKLDIYGRACYMSKYSGVVYGQRVMGYLIGIKDAEGFYDAKARIALVENMPAITKDYKIARTVNYGDGLDKNTVESSIGSTDGSALYEIELNSKGELKGFYKLKEYEGFEGMSWSGVWGSFIEHGNPYLVVNGKKLFIPPATPVLCIHDDGSDIEFYKINYQSLVGKNCNNEIMLKFYGYEDAPELKLAVMLGNIDVVSGNRGMGMVERFGTIHDENGEEATYVSVNGNKYIVRGGDVSNVNNNDFISYTVSLFEPNAIIVEETLNLSDDLSGLDGKTYGNKTYKYGHIEKIDRLKVILEGSVDGSLCYYYDNVRFYGIGEKGDLDVISYKDIDIGTEVVIGIETDTNGGAAITEVFTRKN